MVAGGAGPATTRCEWPKGTAATLTRVYAVAVGGAAAHLGQPATATSRTRLGTRERGRRADMAQGSGDRCQKLKLTGIITRTTFKAFQKSNPMIQMSNQFFYTQEGTKGYRTKPKHLATT